MASVLTHKFVENVQPTAMRQEIPDGGMKNLYLIVQPSGRKSWAVRYFLGGKVKKYTIGSFPAFKLAEARAEASKVLRLVSEGRDPQTEKKEAQEEASTGRDLVQNLLDEFVRRHVKPNNGPRMKKSVESYIRREIKPRWSGKKIQAIRRRDIVEMLDAVVDRGSATSANRLLATVRKFMNWCVERGLLETSPASGIKAPSREQSRDRVLSDDEIRWLWAASDQIGWPFGPLVRLLLVTGQRREEVAAMRWDELTLEGPDGPTWLIPKERSKNGKEQVVPLSEAAANIIAGLPRFVSENGETSNRIFTTTGETSISGFSRGKKRLDDTMRKIARGEAEKRGGDADDVVIVPFVIHDLRRTAASRMAALGIAPHVVEAVLGHKSGTIKGVAAVYNRHQYSSEKREALVLWADQVEKLTAAKLQ